MITMEAMLCSKTMYVQAFGHSCLLFAFHTTCVLMHVTWTYIRAAWHDGWIVASILLKLSTSCFHACLATLYLASSNNAMLIVCEIIRVVGISLKITGFPLLNFYLLGFWVVWGRDEIWRLNDSSIKPYPGRSSQPLIQKVPWMLIINPC